ncbi:hypothetical protein M409DRAFT_15865 [Zasmidium cellare ATCC 36951]|uniref:Arginase n=1 Tax=Zasmidium cellare ATCC 36951 TaxID=1080233 RepID=A0A6A6D7H4_ZASCE|nr:uncharacterized protein M409DRAFT_15865 [Zasmidium cellare ATCC 36951]KAF2173586.1 hypothetical protein M409DRAFT_15865 [Zasmidium cellare ATCC 36951]
MPRSQAIRIINVPSDVGSMIKGKSLAPEAFQAAELAGKLTKVGYDVEDINALPDGPRVWTFDAEISENGVRNEEANVEVNRRVEEAVSRVLQTDSDTPPFPLIVGGECNIVPAILSAFWNTNTLQGKTIGLLYLDGDCDLTIPNEPWASYNLASMTFTHLTMREGALESMKPFTRPDGRGVCDAGNTVLFGLNAALQGNTRPQLAYLFDEGYRVFTSSSVARNPVGAAEEALAWFEAQGVDCFLLHLDVDAIDATLFPLANVGNRTGVGFEGVLAAVRTFLGSRRCGGLCVAEVNPDHDPGGVMVGALVEELVGGFEGRVEMG